VAREEVGGALGSCVQRASAYPPLVPAPAACGGPGLTIGPRPLRMADLAHSVSTKWARSPGRIPWLRPPRPWSSVNFNLVSPPLFFFCFWCFVFFFWFFFFSFFFFFFFISFFFFFFAHDAHRRRHGLPSCEGWAADAARAMATSLVSPSRNEPAKHVIT